MIKRLITMIVAVLMILTPDAFNADGTLTDELFTSTMGTGPHMFDSQKYDFTMIFRQSYGNT